MKLIMKSFFKDIELLKGEKCWAAVAGSGTGSTVSIDFGGKIKRKNKINNPHVSRDVRNYKSELSLFISCSWRLETNEKVICSSTSSNANNGTMVKALKKIVNITLKEITLIYPSLDLILLFENSYALKIFCDQTNIFDEIDNYSYFTKDSIYTVATGSILQIEKREIT